MAAVFLFQWEICLLLCRFDPVVSSLKGLVPDGFIYLHATPETCMRRMASRCALCQAPCQMGCGETLQYKNAA